MFNRKTLLIGGAIFVVLVLTLAVLSLGSEKKTDNNLKNDPEQSTYSNNITDPKISFVADEVAKNYLEVKTASNFNIARDLGGYFSKVQQNVVSEIIFVDEKNVRQTALDIADSSGIKIPESVLAGGELKMYIFKREMDLGFSEALVIKNQKKSEENQALMRQWENSMINDLKNFILIGEKYDLVKASEVVTFSDSYYRNGRFANFTQGAHVTLDYLVADDYIIVANSIGILNEIASQIYESKLLKK